MPARHRFVILGDRGIHEKVGQEFRDVIAGALTTRFKQGDLTGGIVTRVEAAGEELARYFPYLESDVIELPDDVEDLRRR